ncbi:hypothetical protein PTSG_08942 [Salpingoeca rosetta]|uniref:Uncharacterized protein n=1 Tax=Salpingoeca rosetta (strain ATCC 50818 / BSB-021) TaxID=946362 RepID=F2ULR4_SALR5|nr:uncharacterized protein PTSG_08942 [Salpingoeca rosetta]EGD78063.1 hypothetical protein PTSG_08942 [Salpingoeca rosetta]|eukprot:XP_004989739.1 hypothetical protein PTSG_08942 [Salpingoeca rosetta]
MDGDMIVAQPRRVSLGVPMQGGGGNDHRQHRHQQHHHYDTLSSRAGHSGSGHRRFSKLDDPLEMHAHAHPKSEFEHFEMQPIHKQPRLQQGFGAHMALSHTNRKTGGICSCEQSEVFPKRYELIAESGAEWFGLHQRRRPRFACWLADCLPAWCSFCPLQRSVELHRRHDALLPAHARGSSGSGGSGGAARSRYNAGAQMRVEEQPTMTVDLTPTTCMSMPCLDGLASRDRAVLYKNGQVAARVLKRGVINHITAPCRVRCGGSQAILSVEPVGDNTKGVSSFYIPSERQCCRACGCWLLAPHACCGHDTRATSAVKRRPSYGSHTPAQFLVLPILEAGTGEKRASLVVSGDWAHSTHTCCKRCSHLEDDYEVRVELIASQDRPCSEQEAELLLALALYFDDRWLVPHLQHPLGPVTMPKLCMNICDA